MKLNKEEVIKALETITAPGTGENLIDSKTVTNIMVFGDEIDIDIRLFNPSLQARKKLEVSILEVIHQRVYAKEKIKINIRNKHIISNEFSYPKKIKSNPPTKNPKPFIVFFEPVKTVTHLKSFLSSEGAKSLTELFELIFVRSFAIPDKPWKTITKINENSADQF